MPKKALALRCGLVPAEATALSHLIHCPTNRISVVPSAIRVVTSDRGEPDGEFDSNQNRFSFARGVATQLLIPTGASPTEIWDGKR
jgi:hypothetical protein